MKRDRKILIRLSPPEHERLLAEKPPDEELASFARRALMESLADRNADPFRRASAFIVAALSDSIEFGEALALFDEHMNPDME